MRNRNAAPDPDDGYTEELHELRRQWIRALEAEELLWEGKKAMRELKSKKALQFLRGMDFRPRELLDRILKEINAYRWEYELLCHARAPFLTEYEELRKSFLPALMGHTAKQRKQVHYPALKKYLGNLEQRLQCELNELKRAKELHSRSPLTAYEGMFPRNARSLVGKKIDLDTRLQVQMAKMFNAYLEEFEITRWTIARLIVLTYLVAELAEHDGGYVRIVQTGRILNPRTVHDKIATLDLAELKAISLELKTKKLNRRGGNLPKDPV